ncbi:glycoside hydrolase family 127 protein [Kutzneria kofuensis]|uniref:LamG-like jellyroll fold domain-containing protein n=1 Tax=Kutzneria kofuensis TaxID=103725 RepID=A0A7W9NKP5_9PSEU|nr:beta-L-arabinofuranosidase domain-containing protein [Kutzneria kofuensis]MBB5896857.1 hypothetical protein [Kutzneria kofuensis]
MTRSSFDRRGFLKVTAAGALVATAAPGVAHAQAAIGNPADGTAGASFPLTAVRLNASAFADNQARNTSYLNFVDSARLLHTFRLNVGLPSTAQPCGGWESPTTELRGHSMGHLLSGLALTYANTGDQAVLTKGRYLVGQLAACQARAAAAGFHPGYLSAFPENFFDRLEAGSGVWAPYYTIHKIMAGLIDQYALTGNTQALDVVTKLADWVDWRTARLSDAQMQQVMETEFGGVNEALANVYLLTGVEKYLTAAKRFYHRRIFDPLAAGVDRLSGNHANTQIPKMIGALRIWEHTGEQRFHDIAWNFWDIVVRHHTYIIGGNSNGEAFHDPDVIAGQLSNNTCENCNSYNMLKLTRLIHFHDRQRTDLLDYYERTLFNQMLGEQDPSSPHGFNIYYTGLSAGAFKQQPSFMGTDPNAYSTDYDNFSCDHGTGMETQAKFADTIYSRDAAGLSVNLFVPSQVSWPERNLILRQDTGFPDDASTRLTMTSSPGQLTVRVRIPSWVSATPRIRLNGADVRQPVHPGSWFSLGRQWKQGDTLDISLPMSLRINPTPDDPSVQAVTYGPVVLAGGYGNRAQMAMPRLDTASVKQTVAKPMTFTAKADGQPVTLTPISRTHHQHYTVYWLTGTPPPPPPAFAAWYQFNETSGTVAADSSGNGKNATLTGGASWSAGTVQLNGTDGYVQLPAGVINGATAYSVATRVRLDAAESWSRIFDFGTGTTAYMFLTPNSSANTLRYAITAGGADGEQQINASALPVGSWHHVAVTYGNGVGILYVDGVEVGRNNAMSVQPLSFGNDVKQNYLGKSQYADPYLRGALDDFRLYGRTLSPSEVAKLAAGTEGAV